MENLQIHVIEAGSFLCDGGGIFGGVPKILWSRKIEADDRNMIRIAMRSLLVVSDNRKILIDSGAGTKLNWKFIDNNGVEDSDQLIESLRNAGCEPENITDVVHTHLHWDHCGGGTRFDSTGRAVLTFPNATYHCSKAQWDNAMNPNPREGDAYFADDLIPVKDSGKLNLVNQEQELIPGFELRLFNGHTSGLIVPVITLESGKKMAYVTDLAPLAANVPLKWIAAYDLLPVVAMEEKEQFFKEIYDNEGYLFFQHDMDVQCCNIKWDDRKGPMVRQSYSFEEIS